MAGRTCAGVSKEKADDAFCMELAGRGKRGQWPKGRCVHRRNGAGQTAQDRNVNPVLQEVYNEAYRRAQLEADYYNAEYAEVLADNTNQNPVTTDDPGTPNVNEAAPFSIASRNAAYTTENNKRIASEADLRSKVAAREAATANVQAQFNNAQSFYDQLVARRMALKATADKAVADATADGGTAPENLTDAQEAAQKALAAAAESRRWNWTDCLPTRTTRPWR